MPSSSLCAGIDFDSRNKLVQKAEPEPSVCPIAAAVSKRQKTAALHKLARCEKDDSRRSKHSLLQDLLRSVTTGILKSKERISQKETKITKSSRQTVRTKRSLFPSLSSVQNLLYLLSFIPSGISGGGALIRLWLLP
jgi:hypothetical protein